MKFLLAFSPHLWKFILILLATFVVLPTMFYGVRLLRLIGQKRQWQRLEENSKICELIKDSAKNYSQPIKNVLNMVLTDRAGVANPQALAPALDYLTMEMDSSVRSLRSLSYLSVLLGLLGTVTYLAVSLAQPEVKINTQLLKDIYPINALCIAIAVFIFIGFQMARRVADGVLLCASRALGELQTELPPGIQSDLVRALDAVAQRFTDWGEQVNRTHLQRVQELFNEVQSLGEAIREMVGQMISARQDEEKGLIPLFRQLEQRTEDQSQRLDKGFIKLAQPFEKGIPILEKWEKTADSLNSSIEKLHQANLKGSLDDLKKSADTMTDSVTGIPEKVQQSLQKVGDKFAQSAQTALQIAMEQAVRGKLDEVNQGLKSLDQSVKGLAATLDSLPQTIQKSLSGLSQGIVAATSQAVQQSLDPLVKSGTEMQAIFKDLLLASDAIKTSTERLTGTMQGGITKLGETLKGENQTLRVSLEQTMRSLSATFDGLPRVLQGSLSGLSQAVVTAIGQAVERGLDQVLKNNEGMQAIMQKVSQVSDALRTSVDKLPNTLVDSLKIFGESLRTHTQELRTSMDQSRREILVAMPKSSGANFDPSLQNLQRSVDTMNHSLQNLVAKVDNLGSTEGFRGEMMPHSGIMTGNIPYENKPNPLPNSREAASGYVIPAPPFDEIERPLNPPKSQSIFGWLRGKK